MTVDLGGNPLDASPARTLGESLRNTRISAGASIEQVESDLRIKAKYIEAIEDGDIAALPSRAYTDGFLRNYATYLGHSPTETVARFAGENGLPGGAVTKTKAAPIKVKHKAANPLAGIGHPPPRGSVAGSVGRGVFALWPLVLVAGLGFGGYTGFVAARDAGLIPAEIGGIALSTGKTDSAVAEPTKTAAVTPEAQPANPEQSDSTAPDQPAETAAAAPADQPEADSAPGTPILVGSASPTGGARPDRLSYARAGATPYWQAKPPVVEPADGPVSEIEPETAGLIRAEAEDEEGDKPSRWSGSVDTESPTSDDDASRIAAEAREALAATLGLDVAPFDERDPDEAETAAVDGEAEPLSDAPSQPDVMTETAEQPLAPNVPGIGPIVTQDLAVSDFAPAEPAQAPRRFALIAQADTWVQVQDAIGTVTYTGILSAGEAYNIPNQEGLRLKTGNAGGLFIEVDGQRFGPLGSDGAVMRNVVLNPGAVRASFTLSRTATLSQ